jgi:glycosyltransferase involved in cell wall biosynthesis
MRYGASLAWMPMELMSSERWFDCLCIWSDNPLNLKPWDQTLPDSSSVCVRLVNQSNRENIDKILCSGKRIGLTQTDWFAAHNTNLGKYPLYRWNNGVYPEKFIHVSDALKMPGKIFYGSDYDRGLIYILDKWDSLKKKYPHITLVVCYGWEIFDKKLLNADAAVRKQMLFFRERIETLLQQDGITHLGRISHKRVDEELVSSEFWFYPCTFPENCSTLSLKAQAAKCVPVIIPTAGLQETVRYGLITRQGLWNRGSDDQIILPYILDEWALLADEAIARGYAAFQDITEANWRRVVRNYSYPQLVSNFINRFF